MRGGDFIVYFARVCDAVVFAVVLSIGLCLASFVWIFQRWIIALFSGDQQVLAVAFSLMMLVCWMHIFDAILVISVNMLRCWKEVVLPMFIFTTFIIIVFYHQGIGSFRTAHCPMSEIKLCHIGYPF